MAVGEARNCFPIFRLRLRNFNEREKLQKKKKEKHTQKNKRAKMIVVGMEREMLGGSGPATWGGVGGRRVGESGPPLPATFRRGATRSASVHGALTCTRGILPPPRLG